MMKDRQKEVLKDVIIDYLYDFQHHEKVRVIKGKGLNLQVDTEVNVKQDTELYALIKAHEIEGVGYGYRGKEYCQIISGGADTQFLVHSKLLDRLERIKLIKRSDGKSHEVSLLIDNAIQALCDRSYLARNYPVVSEVKLTPKGIQHYEKGSSFEKDYFNQTSVKGANKRSWVSTGIAVASLLFTFGFKACESSAFVKLAELDKEKKSLSQQIEVLERRLTTVNTAQQAPAVPDSVAIKKNALN